MVLSQMILLLTVLAAIGMSSAFSFDSSVPTSFTRNTRLRQDRCLGSLNMEVQQRGGEMVLETTPLVPPRKELQLVKVTRGPSDRKSISTKVPSERITAHALLAFGAIAMTANSGMEFNDVPMAESLLSLVAGVSLVSAGVAAVEQWTAPLVPPYNPTSQRYDQTNFVGRFCRMFLACDPQLLLYNEEEVRNYDSLVKDYQTIVDGTRETDQFLWEARRIADSALHPETGEWIPRAFRMSGYIPFNGPICVAMVASQSTLSLLVWSWLNQSQNALVNYFNRSSGSSKTDNTTLIKSYVIAVGSALVIAFGLETLVESNFSGEEAAELLRFVSFPSAVIASSLNCFVVRSPEIESGVPLLNAQLEDVLPGETSQEAAKMGVYMTTASRAVLQLPTYLIPPLILDTVGPLKEYMCLHPTSVVPITTFLLLISFGIGLPCVIGMMPQLSKISSQDAEEKYRDLGHDELFFDKGL